MMIPRNDSVPARLHLLRDRLHAFLCSVLLLVAATACSGEIGDGAGGEMEAEEEAVHEDEHATGGPVTLTEAAMLNAGIEVSEVTPATGATAVRVQEVPGRVELSPDRVALISPRTSGRLERLTAVEGDRVQGGAPVAYLLSTPFSTAQQDFIQATTRAEMLAGSSDEEGARALVTAAERRLELLGAPPDLLERLRSGGEPQDLLPVAAPFDGSLLEAYALEGAALEAGSPIFRIGDLSVVDVVADVPEETIAQLELGRAVTVQPAAYPDRSLTGHIERLHDELDPATRTLAAIIHVPNSDRALRPGMFVSVDLRIPMGEGTSEARNADIVMVPASAVVSDGAARYVFVEIGPRTFEQRAVDVVQIGDGSQLHVREGLAPGERLVVRGAFTLKSELAKGGFGDEH
jgi:multidrug efflux pump subunit AcrA (membrane-fusion protein)